ncbi:Uu.00g050940.m01.CDS01 [Anthostomella pinea]|uniref:Uu.00g050940.m01.CDS01 n=1 Tax=Anthostomella pinea TaxID=933095 RepID=A0AAI8VSP3_9PEZI|nr:Uu.00g050940.m01.CDS01 [Anthostomella pinea]
MANSGAWHAQPAEPGFNNILAPNERQPLTVAEIEHEAKLKLPKNVYDFYAGGSDREKHWPKTPVHSTVFFGWTSTLPIGIAPSAMQKLAGGDGELDVGRAADVARTRHVHASTPPVWIQLYLYQKNEKSVPLIRRAEDAGYEALVLTVDTPVLGNRLAERRVPVVLPPGIGLPNLPGGAKATGKPSINRRLMNAGSANEAREIIESAEGGTHSSSLTWEGTMAFLRRTTRMKVILKGIMTGEDAKLAVQHGADAIIVSNHGGRQLDSASSTIEALPEIVEAMRGRIPVIFDGGIRTGSDVFKALALGADFVLVGRPALWGLAYAGREGVEVVMQILERELSRTMALAGVSRVRDIRRSHLGVRSADSFGIAKL